jgi:uroporphyrinogen III methyltransferase/synthase
LAESDLNQTGATHETTTPDIGGGQVFLIGAGPGDPKLLTIRAAEAIAISDVIVYDHLVNPEVLVHARRGAELIYAGKKAGATSIEQSEINQTIIKLALRGRTVARLKGGDPFIFGRGGEEAEALAAAGIKWEVIPGVSSGFAAAAYSGIPLTHRDYSSSVAFITGHESPSKNRDSIDWSRYATTPETLVVFMCARTIDRIARRLIAAGRPRSTPAAIIRWATYQEQEVYYGSLEEIAEIGIADHDGLASPASPASPSIAIIGEVVSLREKLRWFGLRELEYPLCDLLERALVPTRER